MTTRGVRARGGCLFRFFVTVWSALGVMMAAFRLCGLLKWAVRVVTHTCFTCVCVICFSVCESIVEC